MSPRAKRIEVSPHSLTRHQDAWAEGLKDLLAQMDAEPESARKRVWKIFTKAYSEAYSREMDLGTPLQEIIDAFEWAVGDVVGSIVMGFVHPLTVDDDTKRELLRRYIAMCSMNIGAAGLKAALHVLDGDESNISLRLDYQPPDAGNA